MLNTYAVTNSLVGIEICAVTAGIKTCKSVIKKKKVRHYKIVSLGKDKLDTSEILISNAFIDAYYRHGEFVSVNDVLGGYDEIKEGIKIPETSVQYITKKTVEIYCVSCKKRTSTKIQVSEKLTKID